MKRKGPRRVKRIVVRRAIVPENTMQRPAPNNVGQGQRPDDRVGHVQIVLNHLRSGVISQKRESAEEDRHRTAARDAEDQCRNQPAAFLGVVRGFRPDHAAYVARTEAAFVLDRLHRVAIGDPVHDRPAKAGNNADNYTDDGAPDRQKQIGRPVADSVHPAGAEPAGSGNRRSCRSSATISGTAKMPKPDDDQLQTVGQIGNVVGRHPQAAARARLADGTHHQTEPAAATPLSACGRPESPPWTGRGS